MWDGKNNINLQKDLQCLNKIMEKDFIDEN